MPAAIATPAGSRRIEAGVAAGLVLALGVAAWANRDRLNTDGIAYLRIAHYYAHGDWTLAVSGYWGPLLSWLAVPALWLGADPLAAGRMAMALSAVVFWLGARALVARLDPAPHVARTAGILIAGAAVLWSGENITPDLLAGGLVCAAIASTRAPSWTRGPRPAILAGGLWAAAYYAKAIALPLAGAGGLMMLAWAGWRERARRAASRAGTIAAHASLPLAGTPPTDRPMRSLAWTALTCALLVAPWIVILSVKYGHPTFSTTARIAHALAGPTDVDRYHPFARQFHRPDPGRITAWEDPSRMPYRTWSPWESPAYFKHQLRIVTANGATFWRILRQFDAVGLAPIALLAALLLASGLGRSTARPRWLEAALLPAVLIGLYLPFAVTPADVRYFYACYPGLLTAAFGAAGWAAQRMERGSPRARLLAFWLVVVSFAAPIMVSLPNALVGAPDPASYCAHQLAARLTRADRRASVAGSGLILGGRAGLYTAFLIDRPWLGDVAQPTADDYSRSGAGLIVVGRQGPVAAELEHHADFEDLDARLFGSEAEARAFPLQVFARRH